MGVQSDQMLSEQLPNMRFIIFTRTMWSEQPRLRKQVANMLLDYGHDVHFFEKRKLGRKTTSRKISDKLTLHTSGHLIHHQLKIFAPLNTIDAAYLRHIIGRQVSIRDNDIVVNFCYDFFFLRDLFPKNPIIHMVNDDYISAAIPVHRKSAKRLLHLTAKMADHNLAVSYSIENQLLEATEHVSLFFPWARHQYELPIAARERNEVLYWGYINERIDEERVTQLMDEGITINFVGAVIRSGRTDRILSHVNANTHGVQPLESIPEVRARCSCAIIPYDIRNPYTSAITISNRGFELLSFGFPLLFTDLPNLIRAPFSIVYRCKSITDFKSAIDQTRENFDEIQPEIRQFLLGHTVGHRYEQFMSVVKDAIQARETAA